MRPSLFDPGLEHTTVARTELSSVDEETGDLLVGGFPVAELATNATYEEACFLLLHGRLPTAEELSDFRADLADRRGIDEPVRATLERAAAEGASATTALRAGLAATDLGRDEDDRHATAKRVVATVPTVVAAYWRYRRGESPVAPRGALGHAASFRYMLTGEEPDEAEVEGLETFLTAVIDHGLNPSTFAARVVASTGSDLVSAATAAVGALGGPRHGGDLGPVFDVLREAHESGAPERVAREYLSTEEGLPGFGHAVYRVRDPRAAVLAAAAERFFQTAGDEDFLATVRELESVGADALAERESAGRAAATVEFYMTALLHGVGVPRDLFTATFAVGRVGGWVAHCLEQADAGGPVRPVGHYVGETDRTWTPVEDRYLAGDTLLRRPVRSASLEPVSETLAALSEPTRLELLLVLYDQDGPVSYSRLRDATTVDDKGRLNYHLRKLRGHFVADSDAGYELTDAGRALVHAVVTEERLLGGLE